MEETFPENNTAQLTSRESCSDKEKEVENRDEASAWVKGLEWTRDFQVLRHMPRREKHRLSLRSVEFWRRDKTIHQRSGQHLLLQKRVAGGATPCEAKGGADP
ncbi:unnamed protein product [Lota lota]